MNTRKNIRNVYCFVTNYIQQDETTKRAKCNSLKDLDFSGVHIFVGKTITSASSKEVLPVILFRAQHNGCSMGNVHLEC